MIKKLSLQETIEAYTNENGFSWGTNTAIKSLAPDASYDLTCVDGEFIIDRWESKLPQPTSREIKDEYIRQQTIFEFIDYLKSKNFDINKI